jgi:hypothetical protein
LNSRANLRLVISTLQFLGHDFIFVPTKPAAAQRKIQSGGLRHSFRARLKRSADLSLHKDDPARTLAGSEFDPRTTVITRPLGPLHPNDPCRLSGSLGRASRYVRVSPGLGGALTIGRTLAAFS